MTQDEKIDIYNEVDSFVEENEGEVTNTEIARHFLELGRNNAIDNAVEWLRNNWHKYINIDADGVVCFGHWENDFRKAMEGE